MILEKEEPSPMEESTILTATTQIINDDENLSEYLKINSTLRGENLTQFDANFVEADTINSEEVTELIEFETTTVLRELSERVGSYIALGFFFAFIIAVIALVSVVVYCCVKRRKNVKLEKSIVKVENPKYASESSRYHQSFDFLSAQNVRSDHNEDMDESSVKLINEEMKPTVSVSIDIPSSRISLSSLGSNKVGNKRSSRTSDFPAASVTGMLSDTTSEVGSVAANGSDRSSLPSVNKKVQTNHNEGFNNKFSNGLGGSPKQKTSAIDDETGPGKSESPSVPFPGGNKTRNSDERFIKPKDGENVGGDDDDDGEDETSHSLLKPRTESTTSVDSYDPLLNPFHS